MNCKETTRFLHGYLDAELALGDALAVEEHLQGCPRCRTHHANLRAVQTAVRRHIEHHAAPASLRARLAARYGDEDGSTAASTRRWSGVAAAGAAALLLAAVWIGAGSVDDRSKRAAQLPAKVVVHISQSGSATAALRNLANHLEASPGTTVVVVAHNEGVDFLMRGARDASGQLYESAVAKLKSRGVDFRICGNTLVRLKFDSGQVIPAATLVPSGVAEISRLQTQEGYAYLRL
ncbi:MAG: zf-HC2 domain-containing protein [Betaproteobacteria bacterium]|nr:zf-HC2 domain-containing protein [Betaproteobacteria bacterium]